MLNLNQLRVFYQVAVSLNYSAAAEKLCVTQPAVSKQIKLLEEFCELKLFIKKKNKLYLTDEGRKIHTYACRIFELERQLEEMISGLINLKYGSLRIATTKTYARRFFTKLISLFQIEYPHIVIELDEGSSIDMANSLLNFKNSIAIVAEIENNPDIVFIPLLFEEVVLITAPTNKLLEKRQIDFTDLRKTPIIMKEVGSGTRKLIDESFNNHHIRPNVIAQSSNMEFIKNLVLENKGISFVVRSAVEKELLQKTLNSIPLKNGPLYLNISIAFLKGYELPQAAKMFLEYLLPVTKKAITPKGMEEAIDMLSRPT